ncbi:hypothetical protein IWW45_004147 [Coemansia sp. RSA 485]|nr:hypothetical protein IWW45_004147 [Coemansia sp. RSA 485]
MGFSSNTVMDNRTGVVAHSSQQDSVSSSQPILGYAAPSTLPQSYAPRPEVSAIDTTASLQDLQYADSKYSAISSEADAVKEDSVQPTGDADPSSGRRSINSSKRAAQNRAAQRAFRLRRERYVASLEEKARSYDRLESAYVEVQRENQQLRAQLHRVQAENSTLRAHMSSYSPMPHNPPANALPESFTPTETSPAPYHHDVAEAHPVMIGGTSYYPEQGIGARQGMHPNGMSGEYDSAQAFYSKQASQKKSQARKASAQYSYQHLPVGSAPISSSYPQYQPQRYPHQHQHHHQHHHHHQQQPHHHQQQQQHYYQQQHQHQHQQLQNSPKPTHPHQQRPLPLHPPQTQRMDHQSYHTGSDSPLQNVTAPAAVVGPGTPHDLLSKRHERSSPNPSAAVAAFKSTTLSSSFERTSSPCSAWESGTKSDPSALAAGGTHAYRPSTQPEKAGSSSNSSALAIATIAAAAAAATNKNITMAASTPTSHALPSVREITRSIGTLVPGSPGQDLEIPNGSQTRQQDNRSPSNRLKNPMRRLW